MSMTSKPRPRGDEYRDRIIGGGLGLVLVLSARTCRSGLCSERGSGC